MAEMTLREIVEKDLEKNYKGRGFSLADAAASFKARVDEGEKPYRAGNTIFMTKELGDGGVEWHTINPEPSDQLIRNVTAYFLRLREGKYKYATTYYDNPKINDLIKKTIFPVKIERVNDGEDRTYRSVVRL
jgi:hypothetical protein